MKFEITVFTNTTYAVVKNIGENDFLGNIKIKQGEEVKLSVSQAKHYFGNWEDKSFGERTRQKELNIDLYDIEIRTETAQIQAKEVQDDQTLIKRVKVAEFESLDGLNASEKEDEPENCKGTTKAGKPCKAKATENGYCAMHKEQE